MKRNQNQKQMNEQFTNNREKRNNGFVLLFCGAYNKKKTNLGYWWKGIEVLRWGCLWVKAKAAVVPAFFARTECESRSSRKRKESARPRFARGEHQYTTAPNCFHHSQKYQKINGLIPTKRGKEPEKRSSGTQISTKKGEEF